MGRNKDADEKSRSSLPPYRNPSQNHGITSYTYVYVRTAAATVSKRGVGMGAYPPLLPVRPLEWEEGERRPVID